jgi:hypothetical protein
VEHRLVDKKTRERDAREFFYLHNWTIDNYLLALSAPLALSALSVTKKIANNGGYFVPNKKASPQFAFSK